MISDAFLCFLYCFKVPYNITDITYSGPNTFRCSQILSFLALWYSIKIIWISFVSQVLFGQGGDRAITRWGLHDRVIPARLKEDIITDQTIHLFRGRREQKREAASERRVLSNKRVRRGFAIRRKGPPAHRGRSHWGERKFTIQCFRVRYGLLGS